MGNTKAADRAVGNLSAGFFDYSVTIAGREPKKAAASLMVLNSILDLIRSDGSTEFAKAVPEDIHTMIGLAEDETRINVQEMGHGREAVTN